MCNKIDKDVMTPPKWHEKPMPILDDDPIMEEPSPPKTPIVSPMEEPEEQCYMGMGLQGVEVKDTSKKVVELVPIHTCVSNMAMVTTRSRRATRHQPPNEGGDPSGSGQPNENTQPPPNQQDGAPQGGGDGGVDAPNDGNDDHGGHDGGENPNSGGGGDDGDDGDRPLEHKGQLQAKRLLPIYLSYGIKEVHTSDALRCTETVEPMTRAMEITPIFSADLSSKL